MIEPRVEYRRSYILLPQMSDAVEASRWRQAAAIGTAGELRTVGHSADDAGVGPEEREVIAVNPDEWEGDLETFFRRYYAGVEYVSIEAETPAELAIELLPELEGDIALMQTDPRWEDYDFGEHPGGGVLGEYGCLVTCLAMILRKVYRRDVTPPILDELLVLALSPYTRDNLLIWESLTPLFDEFGPTLRAPVTHERMVDLTAGRYEIVLHEQYPSHFVLFEEWASDEEVRVVNPLVGREVDPLGKYHDLRAIEVEDTEPP